MRRHGLGIFERAAGFQIRRDPGGLEGMAVNPHFEASGGRAPADHAVGVDPVHGMVGEHTSAAHGGAEEGTLAAIADPRRLSMASRYAAPALSTYFSVCY